MYSRQLGMLLLQQCAASELWVQQCCRWSVACLSTSAAAAATGAASSVLRTDNADSSSSTDGSQASSSAEHSRQQRHSAEPKPLIPARDTYPMGYQYLHLTFSQLHDNIMRALSIHNPQSEAKMRVLIAKASTPDEVNATAVALRHNYMKRCRLKVVEPFGPEVLHELLRAGQKANMGSMFAVRLLEEANYMGLKTSFGTYQEVIRACLKNFDYLAANRAWILAKGHCIPAVAAAAAQDKAMAATAAEAVAATARQAAAAVKQRSGRAPAASADVLDALAAQSDPTTSEAAAATAADAYALVPAAAVAEAEAAALTAKAAKARAEATAAAQAVADIIQGTTWASKSLTRMYLSGMIRWLKQGELGHRQQKKIIRQVKKLADELAARGANVAWVQHELRDLGVGSGAQSGKPSEGGKVQDGDLESAEKPAAA